MNKAKQIMISVILVSAIMMLLPISVRAEKKAKIEFTAEEQNYINTHKNIKVGSICVYPYFKQQKGQPAEGIFTDIFELVSQRSGINIRVVAATPGKYAKDLLRDNECDVVVGVEGKSYKNIEGLLVGHGLLESKVVPVVRNDNLLIDFQHDKITAAIPKAFVSLKQYIEQKYHNIRVINYSNNEGCIQAVKYGEADVFLQDTYVTSYIIQSPYYSKLQLLPNNLVNVERALLSLDTKNNRILMSILNKCIESINESERQSIIINNTYATQYKVSMGEFIYQYKTEIAITVSMFALLILALSLLVIMKRRNEAKFKRINSELQLAVKQAEEANREKTNFLSRMSHDIRTPMNAIMGMTELAHDKVENKEVASYLERITECSEYLLSLINDILDVGRIESGKITLQNEDVDADAALKNVETIMNAYQVDKNISLVIKRDDKNYRYLYTDPIRLQQVFVNLLSNAYKFSDDNGVVEFIISNQLLDSGKINKTIIIRDYGCGMSEEFQKKIFQPFEQEKNKFSDRYPGSGLGLTICKNVIEAMGGTIEVDSTIGKGTTFTVNVAMDQGKKHSKTKEEMKKSYTEESFIGKKLLLVEDNSLNREIAQKILEKVGFKMESAENGQIALDLFKNNPPQTYDAILMDLRMPVMGGIEASVRIRNSGKADAKSVPIIAMTADAFQEDVLRTREAGMNGHLTKPIRREELYRILYENIKN